MIGLRTSCGRSKRSRFARYASSGQGASRSRNARDPALLAGRTTVLAEIVVVNPAGGERTATVRMTLARPGGDPGLTELTFPDGTSARVSATAAGTPVTRVVRFPPGRSTIRLATTAVPLEDANRPGRRTAALSGRGDAGRGRRNSWDIPADHVGPTVQR